MNVPAKTTCVNFAIVAIFVCCMSTCFGELAAQQGLGKVARTEWRTLSDQEEGCFLELVQRRESVREELAVLARLFDEKVTEKRKLDDAFLARFSIAADKSYRFDRQKRTLFRGPVVAGSKKQADGGLPPDNQEVLHKTLTEAETRLFLRCAEAQEQIQVAIRGIHVLNSQKVKQWNKVRDDLLKAFGIQPDADYSYDKTTRTIYKVGQHRSSSVRN